MIKKSVLLALLSIFVLFVVCTQGQNNPPQTVSCKVPGHCSGKASCTGTNFQAVAICSVQCFETVIENGLVVTMETGDADCGASNGGGCLGPGLGCGPES